MKYQKYLKYIDENINKIPKNATILLSGGSGGLGNSFLHYLVYLNLNVILLLRNVELGNKIKQEVKSKFKDSTSNIEIIYFDYLDLDSINNALKILKTKKIDYFVNNSGIYHQKIEFINNFEKTYLVNFLRPCYFINNLLKLDKNIIIINVGSISYSFTKFNINDIYLTKVRNKSKTKYYGLTKYLLMSYSLYLNLKGYDVRLVHPGISSTNLFAKKNKAYPKLFYVFITPLIKLLFMNSFKASLSYFLALDTPKIDINYNEWFGPKYIFHSFGYPIKYKLNKMISNINLINEIGSKIDKILIEIY